MSLLDRVRTTSSSLLSPGRGLGDRAQSRGKSLLDAGGSTAVGAGLNKRGQLLNRVSDAQNDLLARAVGSLDPDSPLGKAVNQYAEQLGVTAPRRKPKFPNPGKLATWTPAPVWGGVTGEEYFELFKASASTTKSWKNLFWVDIEELTPSKAAPAGVGKLWNMLATDVSFAPVTMPGDMTAVGSANIDHLNGAERVEIRLTTMDTADGAIKRWFLAKADQAAHRDGTFGLPVEYLVMLRLTHMAPTNEGSDAKRFRHAYLVRPSNMDTELSRRDPGMEELQLAFTQFDTFMEQA